MRAPTNPFQCISLTSMWWYLYHFYATMAIKSFKGVTKICQRPCNDGRQIYHHTCRKWPSVKILISVDKKESDMLSWYHQKILFFTPHSDKWKMWYVLLPTSLPWLIFIMKNDSLIPQVLPWAKSIWNRSIWNP